jgi:MarR family transcriptional regulator, lower aerobic nicotinate degradation pathway regulator
MSRQSVRPEDNVDELPVVDQPVHRSGALLDHLARHIRRKSEAVLAPLGLRTRHLVALTVLREQGESTQQSLANTLVLDSTNVVGLLNDLEADGLVERRRSTEDRRRHIVELTDAGNRLLARAEFALAAVEDHVFSGLSDSQREELHDLLRLAVTGTTEVDCAQALDD